VSSLGPMVNTSSFVGSVGERAVSWMEVKGKVKEFGFPASMEMRPGVFSSGIRLLTVWHQKQFTNETKKTTLTRTRYPRLRDIRQEPVVVLLGQKIDHIVQKIQEIVVVPDQVVFD
jgi:hypothetical protein